MPESIAQAVIFTECLCAMLSIVLLILKMCGPSNNLVLLLTHSVNERQNQKAAGHGNGKIVCRNGKRNKELEVKKRMS